MKFKRKFSAEGHKVKMKKRTLQSVEKCRCPKLISSFLSKSPARSRVLAALVCVAVVFAFGQLVDCDKFLRGGSSSHSPSSSLQADYLSVSAAIGHRDQRQQQQQQQHHLSLKRAPAASTSEASSDENNARQQQQAAATGDEQPIGVDSGFFVDSSRKRAPSFEAGQTARVVASSSQTEVFLPCKILDLDEQQTVAWIRKGDSLVLTIDKLRLIDDPRFQLAQSEQDWTLVLSQPSSSDAGLYECQVSSMEPKLSKLVELRMIEAHSRISNLSTLFVKPNEQLNVTCTIESPQRTDFVYWYKNKEPVQFDNLRARQEGASGGQLQQQQQAPDPYIRRTRTTGKSSSSSYKHTAEGRTSSHLHDDDNDGQDDSVDDDDLNDREASGSQKSGSLAKQAKTAKSKSKKAGNQRRSKESNNNDDVKLVRSSSSFIIKQVQANDTGNYTCLPSNAKASHINVIVIENGGQSQPEKRSLQTVDGACSLHIRNTFRLSQEIYLLGQLIKIKLFKALGRTPSAQLNLAIVSTGQANSQPILSEFGLKYEQQSIVNQLFKLIWNEEFIRILLTLISMVFYSRRSLVVT